MSCWWDALWQCSCDDFCVKMMCRVRVLVLSLGSAAVAP